LKLNPIKKTKKVVSANDLCTHVIPLSTKSEEKDQVISSEGGDINTAQNLQTQSNSTFNNTSSPYLLSTIQSWSDLIIAKKPPIGWEQIYEGYDPVPGTRLIPIKSPLNHRDYTRSFSLVDFCERQLKNDARQIGLIIDLSNEDMPLYDYKLDVPNNVQVVKLGSSIDVGPPSNHQVQQFFNIVDDFLARNPNSYAIVHCIYGVNRTGIFISEYLIRNLGFTVEQALKTFAIGRKLAIYQPLFIDELFHRYNQTSSQLYKNFSYPAFPDFVKDVYMDRVKQEGLLEKRSLSFSTFNFSSMIPFDDLSQFDFIELPPEFTSTKKKKKQKQNSTQSLAPHALTKQQDTKIQISSPWADILPTRTNNQTIRDSHQVDQKNSTVLTSNIKTNPQMQQKQSDRHKPIVPAIDSKKKKDS
jgi:hypothetical protein